MASTNALLTILLTLLTTFDLSTSCFTAIFSFGDSLADTGNALHALGTNLNHFCQLPYGQTYFHRPTGRFSDGRVVVDFIAQAVGLPLLPPYLAGSGGQDFRRGVNFAVGGATAMDNDFFKRKGINVTWTNYSLGAQVEWFNQLLPSLCSSNSECEDMLSTSLFLMGEIGGNDYNHPFFQGRTLDEIETFIPSVINSISSAINVVIELGARTLVVPGNFPIGCIAAYLTMFHSARTEDYDPQTGCIKRLNEFSVRHNRQLQDELQRLRQLHPHATIVYADYYEAVMSIFRSPRHFGFSKATLAACCGGGGPYNYNSSAECGDPTAMVCDDPSSYVSWDGLHLTEAAYRTIAGSLLEGPYAAPPLSGMCPHIERTIDRFQQAW